jgi:hypothetical protein
MLSIGIKNSILVILIVLIIHVFLKNLILDKQGSNPNKEKFTLDSQSSLNPFNDQIIPPVPKFTDVAGVDRYGRPQTKEDICRDITVKDSQYKDLEREEMLEYVTKGDLMKNSQKKGIYDDDDLDKYFKDNIVSENVADLGNKFEQYDSKDDICKFKADNHQLPLSTTCSTKITDLNTKIPLEKRVIADCNLPQDKKNIMVLKEYENENTMNGGLLYGNLEAYDELGLNYENYSCSTN